MTVSELIAELERTRAEHGDLPVVIRTDDFFGNCDEVTDVGITYDGDAVRLDAY